MKRSLEKLRAWQRRSKPLRGGSKLERGPGPKRKSRIKPKARSASEFRRIYGSRARVQAIKAMRCTVPHCPEGSCHNAHLENGGMGRKAGWDVIVPLCPKHHAQLDNGLGSVEAFDAMYGTDLRATAKRLATEVAA